MMTINTNGLISALSEFTAITKQVVPDNCKENLLNAITLLSSAIESSSSTPKIAELSSLQESSMMITASVDITVKSSKKPHEKTSLSLSEWINIALAILNLIQTLIHQQQIIINHIEKQHDQESNSEKALSEELFYFREDFTKFTEDFRETSERISDALDLVGDASHNSDDPVNIVDDTINDETHPKRMDSKSDRQKQNVDDQ